MKKDFFDTLHKLLNVSDFNALKEGFAHFYEDFKQGKILLESKLLKSNHKSRPFNTADSLPSKDFGALKLCKAKVLSPLKIRRPKHATTPQQSAKILHSVAHIESSAIILALDSAYRFKNMPLEFYADWLEVASEEIAHFELLEGLLHEIGYKYGDFNVHDGLFDALSASEGSLKVRMGVVHRGLEAKGLDANPFVLAKLEEAPLQIHSKIKEVFHIILRDEVGHVGKGDKWWKYALQNEGICSQNAQITAFRALCEDFCRFKLYGKVLNSQERLKAGFSKEELQALENLNAKYMTKHAKT